MHNIFKSAGDTDRLHLVKPAHHFETTGDTDRLHLAKPAYHFNTAGDTDRLYLAKPAHTLKQQAIQTVCICLNQPNISKQQAT